MMSPEHLETMESLSERMYRAASNLTTLAKTARDDQERQRLLAKAEGMRIAWSYVREAIARYIHERKMD